jgi:arginase
VNAVSLIAVPYELNRLRYGMGRGPERLLETGAAEALGASGATVETQIIELEDDFSSETAACFEIVRRVRERVNAAVDRGAFPVVLSGSCCLAALGVVAGLGESAPGVVWFDAHPDFSTPETATFGYLDGMGLAVLTGDAWQGMLSTVPGARPVPDTAVVLAGARDSEDDEKVRLRDSAMEQLQAHELGSAQALARALEALEPEPTGIYLHVDLDVLDAEEAKVNTYGAAGGITTQQLAARVDQVLQTGLVKAMSLTAYDPDCDRVGRVPPVADRLLRAAALSAPALARGGT